MAVSLARRQLLRGALDQPARRRPPWSLDAFTDLCSRCGDCVAACPPQILVKGDGGFPEIRFDSEGCDFCGACARACPEPVFDLTRPAFPWRAQLTEACLALANVHCQSCQEACEVAAIRFRPALGKPPQPTLDADLCNGCGACLAVCPADALRLEDVL